MIAFRVHAQRHAQFLADKGRQLDEAEKQGHCSDCNEPLTRPLNPRDPFVCGSCDRAYARLKGHQP